MWSKADPLRGVHGSYSRSRRNVCVHSEDADNTYSVVDVFDTLPPAIAAMSEQHMRRFLISHNETKRRLEQHHRRILRDPRRYNEYHRPHESADGTEKWFKADNDPVHLRFVVLHRFESARMRARRGGFAAMKSALPSGLSQYAGAGDLVGTP
jgi:hypothetical protein